MRLRVLAKISSLPSVAPSYNRVHYCCEEAPWLALKFSAIQPCQLLGVTFKFLLGNNKDEYEKAKFSLSKHEK